MRKKRGLYIGCRHPCVLWLTLKFTKKVRGTRTLFPIDVIINLFRLLWIFHILFLLLELCSAVSAQLRHLPGTSHKPAPCSWPPAREDCWKQREGTDWVTDISTSFYCRKALRVTPNMALCHENTIGTVQHVEACRHSSKTGSQVNTRTSASLSLCHEGQPPELSVRNNSEMLSKTLCQQKCCRRGHDCSGRHVPFSCTSARELCCPGVCQCVCNSKKFTNTALPGQALLLGNIQFRGHILFISL